MPTKKPLRSLKFYVLLFTGTLVALFGLILFSVLQNRLPEVLLHAEDRYLQRQIDVVAGLMRASWQRAYMMADDIALWDETALFARGENPDYIKVNWPEASPLQNYRFNILSIKDTNGRDLYLESYDYINDRELKTPEGFSDFLQDISGRVLAKYDDAAPRPAPDGPIEDLGVGGISFFEDRPYALVCMPVMPTRESQKPEGTACLGLVLDNEFFRNLTHYESVDFRIVRDGPDSGPHESIVRENETYVSAVMPLHDMDGKPLRLVMSDERSIFTAGKESLAALSWLLLALTALFGIGLYCIAVRAVLKPVDRLMADLGNIEDQGTLNLGNYMGTRELADLCGSINDMLVRLDQSRVSVQVLQSILNGMNTYIYVADPDTDRILFINESMREHFNIEGEVEGKICWQIMHNRVERCPDCARAAAHASGRTAIVWEERSTATGRYYRNSETNIEWVDGRKVRLHHLSDITESRAYEASLTRRLEQQELMAAMSRSFISPDDTATLITNALRMVGEFMDVSKIVMLRKAGDELTAEYEWYNAGFAEQQPKAGNVPFDQNSIEYRTFIAQEMPYVAHNDITGLEDYATAYSHGIRAFIGVPLNVLGQFWGILSFDQMQPKEWTDSDLQLAFLISSVISGVLIRHATQEDLVRMSSIVDSSPQFISYITPQGEFEYINKGGLSLLGYSEEELMRAGIVTFLDQSIYREVIEAIIPVILAEGESNFELPIRRKNGENRTLLFSAFKTRARTTGVGAIASDITQERLLREELVLAKNQAEQSSHAKGDFLSRMSHEMRTPLNAIIGMTSIAKSAPDLEKKQYCLEKIDEASNHLLGVINDILDMSKIEANKFELAHSQFVFEKMLMRVVSVVNFRADEKHITLLVQVDAGVPYTLVADEQRLAQVIANLLSNAVKFTPEGGTISLNARLDEDADGQCTLRIAVSDTGIGIAREHQERLFHSFEQADGGISRKFGGTGLGLAISKNIVEMMGGRIWVESEEGQGATFIFTIKARRGTDERRTLFSPEVGWGNLRILVVDDAPDVLDYFLVLAEKVGLTCEVAADGESACALFEQEGREPFNLVFVDWQMPGMDGIELTRRIKAMRGADTVVIMISATQWSDIESEARTAGVDGYLPKPLFSSVIVNCINECLSPGQQALQQGRTVEPGAQMRKQNRFPGHRILLAEDIEINREIVLSLLEPTGLVVDCAENGREAVEAFSRNPDAYDMIFMDIHMPEVDGLEATRRIRALDTPRAATIPIVAMTADVFREDIDRCHEAGMDSHIGKPIDVEEMFAILRNNLRPQHKA